MTQITKRQHFVPKFYLKGFAFSDKKSEGWIWEYEKGVNQNPKKKSLKSILWKEFYYEQEEINNVLENSISKMENEACLILKELKAVPNEVIELAEESRGKLAFFIALLFTIDLLQKSNL